MRDNEEFGKKVFQMRTNGVKMKKTIVTGIGILPEFRDNFSSEDLQMLRGFQDREDFSEWGEVNLPKF